MRAKSVNEGVFFDGDEYNAIYKKLEYKFKNSGDSLVDKIKNQESLSNEDLEKLLKKFEYSYRKKGSAIISKIRKELGIEDMPNIAFSNLAAKRKRDAKKNGDN